MKKYLVFFILAICAIPSDMLAQIDRSMNEFRQPKKRQTYLQNIRQIRQNRQRNEQEERVNRQKEYTQQQRNEVNVVETSPVSNERSTATNTNLGNDKVVTLVTNGTGSTKEEAIKNALRSAIEQAFGTFVSANTEVLNDELVKDEIVTVSTGNIKTYNVLSSSQLSSGLYDVSVQAVVSIDQLTKFAQSKGMQAELAGASFIMNMKMRELNRKNEMAAIDHMIEKAKAIAQNGLFDYKLEIGEPKLTADSKYSICLRIEFRKNANTKAFYETIYQTLQSLSLSEKERKEYNDAGLKFYCYNAQLQQLTKNQQDPMSLKKYEQVFFLRNEYPEYLCSEHYKYGQRSTRLLPVVVENALNYIIHDNLGNQFYWKRMKLDNTKTIHDGFYEYVTKQKGLCSWYYIDNAIQKTFFWELYPKSERLYQENENYEKYVFRDLVSSGGNVLDAVVSFNPMVDEKGKRKFEEPRYGIRYQYDYTQVYYHQEFNVIYSEAELSKLTSITINHR